MPTKNIFQYKSFIVQTPYSSLAYQLLPQSMPDDQQSPQPLEIDQIKNPEPQLLPIPQYQLIDDCQIANFLRDRPDDLANSLYLSNPQPNPNNEEYNFQPQTYEQKNSQFNASQNNHEFNNDLNLKNHTSYQSQYQNSVQEPSQLKTKPNRKCICKKTQCLKMYCECFASNLPCTQLCACLDCKNTLKHQKQIIQAKQMIHVKGIVGLHSCSLSQKRCNCKKSNCLKKYCECYNSGVKCSQACKCESCKNCDNLNKDQSENENQKVTKVPKLVKVKKERKNAKVQKVQVNN